MNQYSEVDCKAGTDRVTSMAGVTQQHAREHLLRAGRFTPEAVEQLLLY